MSWSGWFWYTCGPDGMCAWFQLFYKPSNPIFVLDLLKLDLCLYNKSFSLIHKLTHIPFWPCVPRVAVLLKIGSHYNFKDRRNRKIYFKRLEQCFLFADALCKVLWLIFWYKLISASFPHGFSYQLFSCHPGSHNSFACECPQGHWEYNWEEGIAHLPVSN